ncbi:MAG: translocase [Candidatus Nealsonbacteria bacterium]|nr:translocase [Candidatus Nealsonbacteria bacterium]
MFGLGLPEIIIILIAIGILIFGSKKVIEFARSLGRFSGEFKKGKMEIEKELKEMEKESPKSDEISAKKK